MKHVIPDGVFEQNVIVLGKTRSGKSSAMRVMVEGLLDEDKPVCVIDPKGDWWGLKSSEDGKKPGYPVVIFGGEHADVPINRAAGAGVAELFATGNRPCIIDLGGWMVAERTQFFIDFASNLFKTTRGRRWLVIDEVHNFCPKGKIMDPNAGKMLHWANRLASEGLGKGVALIAASQRPQKVHNDFLTSCETLIAMRVIHKSDRDAIEDWIEGAGDSSKAFSVNDLAAMKRGEAWAWSPEIGFGPEHVKFPMFRTYDSFKPQAGEGALKLKGWADVDLEDVKTKLATVLKEAEAKDPEKLKARIRDLEKQLKGAPTKTREVTIADPKAIGRAVNAERKKFEGILRARDKVIRRCGSAMSHVAGILTANAPKDSELEDFLRGESVAPPVDLRGINNPTRGQESKPIYTPPANGHRTEKIDVQYDGEITGPMRKILKALSELRSIGKDMPPKEMVASWAGYSPIGGAFGNPIGKLRSAGLVDYPAPGVASLTDSGLAAIGETSAPDAEEVKERVRNICSGPEWKILSVLFEHGAEEIPKQELADRSGYALIGGAFGNPLGALRTKGLITYPRPGVVKAADWLFID